MYDAYGASAYDTANADDIYVTDPGAAASWNEFKIWENYILYIFEGHRVCAKIIR